MIKDTQSINCKNIFKYNLTVILFYSENKGYAKRRRNLFNICYKAYVESNSIPKTKSEIREMPQLKSNT
jgi:hypothetical protein